ncbi:phosphate-starvation-inducible PsiE family protein [Poseidonibacter lekithochrous]|uniref:phosphate-starvation-inducible PsiE family protein n=1 Tax=Poseidonibacter lekithochrous TaxID=1904463 RepID=UPI0008FCA448|nr:phosphate-starvation-inducible PsiE family protein [Poseidonibacter lekithochrous]QKJ22403.1 putative membrane protein [Poseidonibacter lekithochrous]
MKRTIFNFFSDKLYIELSIASILFVIALATGMLMDFIIYMLYFIIFLEIVRAVVNYIREQRVALSLLVDAFIILALREFIVNVVKVNKEEYRTIDELFSSAVNLNLFVLAGVVIFLLIVRYFSVKTSQKYLFDRNKNKQ